MKEQQTVVYTRGLSAVFAAVYWMLRTRMPHKPKLGQNFLIDHAAPLAIVEALGDISGRTIVEIGPGHGVITGLLASRCARLICIELDTALVKALRFQFREQPQVEIIEADVLKADFPALITPAEKISIVGNLPYYITSDILLKLFANADRIDRAVLMVQREVADRVSASPGVRDYGLLSATTQMYARVQKLFTLPPEAFSPPPNVHSAVIRLDFAPRFDEFKVDATGFDAFLKQSFAQKRKTLANNLRFAGHAAEALAAAWPQEVPQQARAEAIPLEQMATLYRALRSK